MTARRIEALGADVYVEQAGEGRDILLLHGWGCSTALWKPVIDRLSRRARVWALDFPGHGQSGRPPVPWGAEDYARMTAAAIDTLGIAGCDVIGHSHGGRVALLLAAERPELIRRVIVTGAAGLRAAPDVEATRRTQAYKRLRGAADAIGRVPGLGRVSDTLRERLIQQYGSRDYRALDDEMRKTFVKVVNFDIAPYLGKIQAPVLLIWGRQDAETPLWMGQAMEKAIPDAGLVVLEGSHYVYLEQAAAFLRVAEHFLLGGDA